MEIYRRQFRPVTNIQLRKVLIMKWINNKCSFGFWTCRPLLPASFVFFDCNMKNRKWPFLASHPQTELVYSHSQRVVVGWRQTRATLLVKCDSLSLELKSILRHTSDWLSLRWLLKVDRFIFFLRCSYEKNKKQVIMSTNPKCRDIM